MRQQLSINLTVPIPDDSILIKKIELEELQKNQFDGVWWTMKDLEDRINRKREWIKENILFPSKFKRILDIQYGGFVSYPRNKGDVWSFQAIKMIAFLDKNFADIHKELLFVKKSS